MARRYHFDGTIYQDVNGSAHLRMQSVSDTANCLHDFYRAKGSIGSETTVTNGVTTGMIRYYAYDGSAYRETGYITHICDGVSGSDIGGTFHMATHRQGYDAAGVTVVRFRFDDTGQLKVEDGLATLPTYTFTNDPDTGMYRVSSNVLGFAVGSALKLEVASTRIGVPQAGATVPSVCYTGDTNTGINLGEIADEVSIITGGTKWWKIPSTGILTAASTAGIDLGSNNLDIYVQGVDPAAPSAGNCRIFAKYSGASKVTLYARFPTGAIQQIAIEP